MSPFAQALESLNKKDIGEIKSYGRPPAQVEMVMQAVMILRGNEPSWAEAKRQLGKPERMGWLTRVHLTYPSAVRRALGETDERGVPPTLKSG